MSKRNRDPLQWLPVSNRDTEARLAFRAMRLHLSRVLEIPLDWLNERLGHGGKS